VEKNFARWASVAYGHCRGDMVVAVKALFGGGISRCQHRRGDYDRDENETSRISFLSNYQAPGTFMHGSIEGG